ncbi:MAG: DMT family transporter [Anaerolineae bacterium]|nr:DMT family transporter [Anaerolineae bacterium]
MSPIFLLLLATILWGIWGIADKLALGQAHPFTVQWMYAVPFVVAMPLFFWLGFRAQPETNFNSMAFFWAVVASVASILALVLMLFAMRSQPASLAVAITAAYPLVTMFIAVLFKMETFSIQKLAGVVLIIGGLVVLLWQK